MANITVRHAMSIYGVQSEYDKGGRVALFRVTRPPICFKRKLDGLLRSC